ncbi:hypothetical protein J6A31_06855 [bacterium]|nr:hypothetical protein [bacterium]
MFKNFILMLVLLCLGGFIFGLTSSVTHLKCTNTGSCIKSTYIPIANIELDKQNLLLNGLGTNNSKAICTKKGKTSMRNGKTSHSTSYDLVWKRIHGGDIFKSIKLSNYSSRAMCELDGSKINNLAPAEGLDMTFSKGLINYIGMILGLLILIGGLLVPFGVVRVSSKEELAELENNPEYQQKAQETKQAVEDFVQKHGDTIKNIERGISSNADNIQTILRILRNFGIKL